MVGEYDIASIKKKYYGHLLETVLSYVCYINGAMGEVTSMAHARPERANRTIINLER